MTTLASRQITGGVVVIASTVLTVRGRSELTAIPSALEPSSSAGWRTRLGPGSIRLLRHSSIARARPGIAPMLPSQLCSRSCLTPGNSV